MTSKTDIDSILRREEDILARLDNVRRLIEMENTILTCEGCDLYKGFKNYQRKDGQSFGYDLLHDLRNNIQRQLLSITALCYGDNPDIGEPTPMLEWSDSVEGRDGNPEDIFRDMWRECLQWC